MFILASQNVFCKLKMHQNRLQSGFSLGSLTGEAESTALLSEQ